jgi:RNA polymerase sigma factor (sigma-70 family)
MEAANNISLFLEVLESHKGILYKIAHSYCSDGEDRKDLVQEMTAQLWKSFARYNEQYKYSTWIYRIALNTAISFNRGQHRRRATAHPLNEAILEVADTDIPTITDERLALLQRFIAGLKELDKALMLLYLEEKSYAEIAHIMGLSETNVATKISRIKAVLKQQFSTIQNGL